MTGRLPTKHAWAIVLLFMAQAFVALALTALPLPSASAQSTAEPALNDNQLTGMRLFNQSCRVCHTKPQLTSPNYGPELSKESLGGQDGVLRETISNGTPRMPGFKFNFTSAQIDAIVAYLKTVPPRQTAAAGSAGAASPGSPPPARGNSRDAD